MKFLPVVERELRVAARRWGTFWLRTWVAMATIGIAGWLVLMNRDEKPSDVAGYLFYTITGGAMFYCLLIGLSATADSLSEEKRDGTLGLLFLTDLKGLDVVLGKLVANSVNCFYGLLAIIPVLGLPLLMGGITAGQYGSAALALLNSMFFSLTIGLFASACCRSRRKAVLLAFGLIMLLAVVLPGAVLWLDRSSNLLPLAKAGCLCSPITALLAPLDLGGVWVKDWRVFRDTVGVVHAEAWCFLLLAALVAPRSWQDRPGGAASIWCDALWLKWSHGDEFERRRFRKRLLRENAFYWLAARERLKPMWVWMLLGLVGGAWVWGYGKWHGDWLGDMSGVLFLFTAALLNLAIKCWLAAEAVRTLAEERRSGTLELLLVTDLSPAQIAEGQGMALRRQFLLPLLVMLGLEVAMAAYGPFIEPLGGNNLETRLSWLATWACLIVGLVADTLALGWLGMWFGAAARSPRRAYVVTVFAILVLPAMLFAGFCMLAAIDSLLGYHWSLTWESYLSIWFALGLTVDLAFGLWARRRFLARLREKAAARFDARRPWLKFGRAD